MQPTGRRLSIADRLHRNSASSDQARLDKNLVFLEHEFLNGKTVFDYIIRMDLSGEDVNGRSGFSEFLHNVEIARFVPLDCSFERDDERKITSID
ncbi:hypothetical protein TNCV_4065771 [Trichonephila clavipes]|uniref:Uncharacterized protein n=1 Tax=Trichonephila clavipes TaxID=2585209 RepID=A0A8X6WA03_TRICX|nr:hypothetical protein TNCV_4065771 [Trichonephila clavipes]